MAERAKCLQCGNGWSPYRATLRLNTRGRYGPQLAGFNLCEACGEALLAKLGLVLVDGHPMRKADLEAPREPARTVSLAALVDELRSLRAENRRLRVM